MKHGEAVPYMDELNAKIDELALRMNNGFNRVDADIRASRKETRSEFDKIDKRFDRIDKRFEKVDGRFERMEERFDARLDAFYQVLIRACVFAVGLLGVLVTVIGVTAPA